MRVAWLSFLAVLWLGHVAEAEPMEAPVENGDFRPTRPRRGELGVADLLSATARIAGVVLLQP